jgi:hypothetical protein
MIDPQKIKLLIEKWENQLKRFQENPRIAKNLDSSVAMGIQNARLMTLKECIKELEIIND